MRKTASGSALAESYLVEAQAVIMSLIKGTDYGDVWTDDEEITAFKKMLGNMPPDANFSLFLQRLYNMGILEKPITNHGKPFHAREQYNHATHGNFQINVDELTHDAALYCFHNWNTETYKTLWNEKDTGGIFYFNAQDVTAIMLFITAHYFDSTVWTPQSSME